MQYIEFECFKMENNFYKWLVIDIFIVIWTIKWIWFCLLELTYMIENLIMGVLLLVKTIYHFKYKTYGRWEMVSLFQILIWPIE